MPHRTRSGHAPLAAALALLLIARAIPAAAERTPDPPTEKPRRSPAVAMGFTLGTLGVATAIGLGLTCGIENERYGLINVDFLIPFLVLGTGPSAGHLYAGEYWHAVVTSLGRTTAGTMVIVGYGHYLNPFVRTPDWAKVMFWTGALSWLGLAFYDIIDAPFAARRFNERAAGDAFELNLSPLGLAAPAGRPEAGPALGLSLSGRF